MTQLEIESLVCVARSGPLPSSVLSALGRQFACEAPVKLARAVDGRPELRAEVLRRSGKDAAKLARDALDAGQVWLAGDAPRHRGAAPTPDEVAAGLEELPPAWAWEPDEEDGFHVHATGFGAMLRLGVRSCAGGAQVIARSALPSQQAGSHRALVQFALDANRRFRLARLSVGAEVGRPTAVCWDAVVPADGLGRDLPAAVEAVVAAHAATLLPLRALCQEPVAGSYLALQH